MLPADWRKRFRGREEHELLLRPLTTWRIGGPAETYLEPADAEDLAGTVAMLHRIGLPYRVLGGGSNLLVPDRGVRGVVLSLGRLTGIEVRDDRVVAEAGARLKDVVLFAADDARAGLENLTGIPGRVGGAVFGNAGSRHGAIGEVCVRLELLEPGGGVEVVEPGPGFFAYRSSRVGDRIVVRAHLATREGDPSSLRSRIRDLVAERLRTQPGWVGNAGCVFRNPPGDSAGRLIDSAGCKGMRRGGVHVSQRHANFFENDHGGTEADVLALVEAVRDQVRRVHGVELELEVRRWT